MVLMKRVWLQLLVNSDDNMTTFRKQTWHIASWGTWGWIETGLKGIGILTTFIAFATFANQSIPEITFPHAIPAIFLAIQSLFMMGLLFARLAQREIFSITFAIFNVLGHIALVIAMLYADIFTPFPLIFAGVYILGELAKLQFLSTSGYTEFDNTPQAMRTVVFGMLSLYTLFGVLYLIFSA